MRVPAGADRCGVPSAARQRVKAILAGFPPETIRPATTAEDYWWEWAMEVTAIADRTTWPPQVQAELPWRYRERVLSCFALLDEVRAEKAQTRALLAVENLPAPR